MKRFLFSLSLSIALLTIPVVVFAGPGDNGNSPDGKGFEDGYNEQANIFNGTGMEWCMEKVGDQAWCEGYLGPYGDDQIVMKWNEEWPAAADAHENNNWNGMRPDGSGDTWHYKIDASQVCADGSTPTDGGYCIWGSYEVVQSHGTSGGEHIWEANAQPNGYGVDH